MAASALSAVLLLPVLGGDANSARRSDDEERQGQKQQDGEDLGEVSLTQSTLPRRAASRSRSPSQTDCESRSRSRSRKPKPKPKVAVLSRCGKEMLVVNAMSYRKSFIQHQMDLLMQRDTLINLLFDIQRRCPSRSCPAGQEIDILLNTQERAVTALQKQLNALQDEIAAFMGKDDDDAPSGSSSD